MKLTITIPKDKYCYIQKLEQDNTDYATTRMLYHAVKHGKPYLEQEPCDCISREDAIRISSGECHFSNIPEELKKLPSVNPQPKTGHWISLGVQGEVDGQIVQVFTCSECGAISIFRMASGNIVNGDICPNCSARMVEPQERDKE